MSIPFHTSAGTIDLTALQPQDLTAYAIADALSKINRFNGRTSVPWSVAAHSLLVERHCEGPLKGWALLHDAHEVFIGDITSPSVEYICQAGTRTAVTHAIHNAKGKLDRVIGAAWQCPPRGLSEELRRADWLVLQAEMQVFFAQTPESKEPDDVIAISHHVTVIEHWRAMPWPFFREQWIWRATALEREGLLKLPLATVSTSTTLAG